MSQLRIVVAYPDGLLPSQLFRAVQRARRIIERGGYAAYLELLPASETPDDEGAVLVTADGSDFAADFDALVERLTASGRLQHGPRPSRSVAVHRGFRVVGERAISAE